MNALSANHKRHLKKFMPMHFDPRIDMMAENAKRGRERHILFIAEPLRRSMAHSPPHFPLKLCAYYTLQNGLPAMSLPRASHILKPWLFSGITFASVEK